MALVDIQAQQRINLVKDTKKQALLAMYKATTGIQDSLEGNGLYLSGNLKNKFEELKTALASDMFWAGIRLEDIK